MLIVNLTVLSISILLIIFWFLIYLNSIKIFKLREKSDTIFFKDFQKQHNILQIYEGNINFNDSKFYLAYIECCKLISYNKLSKSDNSHTIIPKIMALKNNFINSTEFIFLTTLDRLKLIRKSLLYILVLGLVVNLFIYFQHLGIYHHNSVSNTSSIQNIFLDNFISNPFFNISIISIVYIPMLFLENNIKKMVNNYKIDLDNFFLILIKKV